MASIVNLIQVHSTKKMYLQKMFFVASSFCALHLLVFKVDFDLYHPLAQQATRKSAKLVENKGHLRVRWL